MIYKLRAIPLAVQNDGLVGSNELLAEWMRNDKTMPFGQRGEHTTVRLIDFDHPENNERTHSLVRAKPAPAGRLRLK